MNKAQLIKKAKKYIIYRNEEIKRKLAELDKKTAVKSSFTVYKDAATGRSRWVSISSNAFRDKDGEIVSLKALKTAVKRADTQYKQLIRNGTEPETANMIARGPLRWWHVPGLELGVCDFQAVNGRMLIESGTFKNERIAQKMAKAQDLNISIGFKHPKTEPDKNGVFDSITIFERSPTPPGKAANNFTSLSVKGANDNMNIETRKLKALIDRVGLDNALSLLEGIDTTEKEAETVIGNVHGVSYKETDSPTIAELMETWNAVKEAVAEYEEEETAAKMEEEEEYDMKAYVMKMDKKLDSIMQMMGKREEEEEEEKKEDETALKIAALEAQLAQLKEAAPTRGYRASLEATPIPDPAADFQGQRQKAAQAMGPAGQLFDAAETLTAGLFKQ